MCYSFPKQFKSSCYFSVFFIWGSSITPLAFCFPCKWIILHPLSLMSSVSRLACTVLTQNRRWNFIPVSKFRLSNSSCPSTGLLYTNQLPLNAALVTHLTLPFTHIPTPGISAYHGSPVSIHSTRRELWSPVISPSICLLAFSPVTLPLFFTVLIDWRLALWTFTGTGEYLLTFNLDLSIRCILYNITENAVSHSWHLPSFSVFFFPTIFYHTFFFAFSLTKLGFPFYFFPGVFSLQGFSHNPCPFNPACLNTLARIRFWTA